MFKTNTIKWKTEETNDKKLPSKMGVQSIKKLLKEESGVNSGLLKEIHIDDNIVRFLIKKGDGKLAKGEFPLARNGKEWNAIEAFLKEKKVSQKVREAIKSIGIERSLANKLIKIEE